MLLDRLKNSAGTASICYIYDDGNKKCEYTYSELDMDSDRIASFLKCELVDDMTPIAVYGHKSPLMIASFIGCVKSGRAYCPIDVNTPVNRIQSILSRLNPSLVIAIEPLPCEFPRVLKEDDVKSIISNTEIIVTDSDYVKPDDLYYIIYTSGSTGEPKGVMISYKCLENFTNWALTLVDDKKQMTYLNQAPFSFDLSVMDLYMSLGSEGCLYVLEKDVQGDFKRLYTMLGRSDAEVWVSTPSFADLCLADGCFSDRLMPKLNTFLFCGEVLANKTAKRLKKRFPGSRVINTYGPTESTVAVTSVEITDELLSTCDTLPIGAPKPGTHILYIDDGVVSNSGELTILGDTVSPGYYKDEKLTSAAFTEISYGNTVYPAYKTGDLGYFREGHYYCSGRMDSQIKLHGYRIELGDIENNLLKISEIKQCAVLPSYSGGKVQRLTAYVVYDGDLSDQTELTSILKSKLSELLQSYMIPQRFVYMDALPQTNNGKIDRRALAESEL